MNEFGMHFKNITPLIGACVVSAAPTRGKFIYNTGNSAWSMQQMFCLQNHHVICRSFRSFFLCSCFVFCWSSVHSFKFATLQTSSFKHSSHIFDCMLAIHLYSSVCSQLYFRSPFPRLRGRRGRLLYDLFARKHLISDTSVEKAESAAFRDRGRGRWGQRERSSGDRPQNVEPLPDLITTGGHVNNKTWWKQEQKSAAGRVNQAYKRI